MHTIVSSILPFIAIMTLALGALNGHGAEKTAVAHPSQIVFDSLTWEVPMGTPYRTASKSGTRYYIAEDHALPIVNLTIYFRCGTVLDPKGKEGLGALATHLMRTGGTKKIKSDRIDILLEHFAISTSFSIAETQLTMQARFLSQYTDTALSIIEQMLVYPVFEKQKLEQERGIFIQNVEHRFDNPEPLLQAAYRAAMYPGQSNSRLSSKKSLGQISQKDCLLFHAQSILPSSAIIAAAGDLQRDYLIKRFETMLSKLPQKKKSGDFGPVVSKPAVKKLIVHKKISQAYIAIGLPLFKRPHPDYYSLSIFNQILGGDGFTSRLGSKIRSDEGLTYSIGSSVESNYFYPGTFTVNLFTNHQSVNKAISLILQEIAAALQTAPVTETEVSNSKKNLIDELPSMFRAKRDVVSTYAWNEYFGRSPDHFRLYPDSIRSITPPIVLSTALKHIKADDFTYIVVGDTAQLAEAEEFNGFSLYKKDTKTIVPDDLYDQTLFSGKK